MQALDIKLLRDFRRLWVQALAIALVLAAGVTMILMSVGMSRALDETRDTYYERNRFADIFASARRVPLSLMPAIRDIEGVMAAEARTKAFVTLDLPGRIAPASARIVSLPSHGAPQLNVPSLASGRWPVHDAPDEVVVNNAFAEANGYYPGDTFHANLNGRKRELTIAGTAQSPEFIYTIGPGAMMPDNEGYGILWMGDAAVSAAFDMTGAFNDLSVKLLPRHSADAVIDEIDALLEPYGGQGAYDRSFQISNSFIDSEIEQLRTMALVLPPVFLGITVFLLNMVIGRIVALERTEIGLLKAIGYDNSEVCLHYLLLAGLIAVVGIAIGWVAGGWLSRGMAEIYSRFFNFPYLVYSVPYSIYLYSALLGLAAAALGAIQSALKAARLEPAVAMSPPAPPIFRRNLIDRMLSAMRLSQPTMMILRSLIRWPIRAGLTALGMALAVSVLVASNFFPDSIKVIIDTAFYQSNRQDQMLLFADDVESSALQEVARLPGILQVEGQQYHAAVLRNGPREKRATIEARPPATDLSRVVNEDGTALDAPPGGVLLSDRLAEALELQTGDLVEVEFLTERRETFDIPVAGIVVQFFGLGAYMDQDTLNRLFRQDTRISVANVTVDSGQVDALHSAVKELPELAGTILMTQNRQSFLDTISQNILIMTAIYSALGVIITVGVAYNGSRVRLSERARELASLRILGFSRGEVSFILAGEIMLLALLAQPLGWWIGYNVARFMTEGFSSDLYAIPLVLEPRTYARASLLVLAAALASVLLVRRRLDNLDLVSVMKTRE